GVGPPRGPAPPADAETGGAGRPNGAGGGPLPGQGRRRQGLFRHPPAALAGRRGGWRDRVGGGRDPPAPPGAGVTAGSAAPAGRLASGIAHAFNNLLTVVLTLTDLARVNLPEQHPVREDLRRIADAGEQAARLAGQLLAFSKQRRLVARPTPINPVVRRTLEL